MSETERDHLRERVASGAATGEERDRLAGTLARAIREASDRSSSAVHEMIDELRRLADYGSDRSACTDALAGALLDAQISAFERADPADAWQRLDEIRARLIHGGTPDLLHDRLAAALFNLYRGGQLIDDESMRLAALEELWTRSNHDPSAGACRVALAELLADDVAGASRRAEHERAAVRFAELEGLVERDGGRASARELARALRELVAADQRDPVEALTRVEQLVELHRPGLADPLALRLAELLVLAHAHELHRDERAAELLRDRLRELTELDPDARTRHVLSVRRELGKALHDAAVRDPRALDELLELVELHPDLELRGLTMSALAQVHRDALVRRDPDAAARAHARADQVLASDDPTDEPEPASVTASSGVLRLPDPTTHRAARIRAELRLDHLRIVLASHALAGDHGDWGRAEQLLRQARGLVDRTSSPVELLELFAQMLVNAHVDAGARARQPPNQPTGEQVDELDELLGELRELARANPTSDPLQVHLATALFNAHAAAGQRGSIVQTERSLAELDKLHRAHPQLIELRRRLVMAIVNHHGDTLERDELERAAELLDRLRALARSPDADNQLRIQLVMALGNALAHADDPTNPDERARIVSELRVLAARADASEVLQTLVLDELSERFAPVQ